jgi:hypothetical protein
METITVTGPWRAEVLVHGEDSWAGNGLRFATREDALVYARDLAGRWTLVNKWRAVDDSTETREPYVPGSEDGSW